MNIRYPAIIKPQKRGGYFVSIPDIEEAITQGETIDECLFNAAEVLSLALDHRITEGQPVPKPSQKFGNLDTRFLSLFLGTFHESAVRGEEIWTPVFYRFFLALSMTPPLEILKGANHGIAAQQICPGRTRRGVSLFQPMRPPGVFVWI